MRVEADEVTYNLHILIRFELSRPCSRRPGRGRLARRLERGTAGAWADPSPTTPTAVLQDIHWSAACSATSRPIPWATFTPRSSLPSARPSSATSDAAFARGEFAPLLAWLRAKVHRHGRRYRPARLIELATGAAPDPQPLIDALRTKYRELYQL